MIKIKKFIGVAPPVLPTKSLLDCIMRLKGRNVLELGTGTGYAAIAASKNGRKVTATDINPMAIEACKFNAKLNNANLKIIKSDLFEKVDGKFDIIAFNLPISIDKADSKLVHKVKSIVMEIELLRRFLRYTFSLLNKSVLQLQDRLFAEAKNHLKKEGNLLICIINNFENGSRKNAAKNGYNYEIMKDFVYGKVYRFYLRQ